MLTTQNFARQLRVATDVGEAQTLQIGFSHQNLSQMNSVVTSGGVTLRHGFTKFHHPAQNISLYTISLVNVSDSLDTTRASKSCRRDALEGTTRVGETLALHRGEAGYKGVTNFVIR